MKKKIVYLSIKTTVPTGTAKKHIVNKTVRVINSLQQGDMNGQPITRSKNKHSDKRT